MKVLAERYSRAPIHVPVRETEKSRLSLSLTNILFMYQKEKQSFTSVVFFKLISGLCLNLLLPQDLRNKHSIKHGL